MTLSKHKLSPRHLIIYCVTLLFIFGLIVGWMQSRSMNAMRNAREWLKHTRSVQAALTDFRVSLLQAESSQRGYILTHDPKYLDSYREAQAEAMSQFKLLRTFTADNAWQQRDRMSELEPLLADKCQFMTQTIDLEQGGNHEAVLRMVRNGTGWQDMSSISSIIGSMQEVETKLLLERQYTYQHNFKVNYVLSVVSLALGLGTTILILFIVRYMEKWQAELMRHALTEVFRYEKGEISVTEYMQRRIREMEANGITRDEARSILGLEAD